MRLIAAGRDCDVFDRGDGTVLRRARSGRSLEAEGALLIHLAEHDYPVPHLVDADGPDLVMELVAGRTMLGDLARRPWALRSSARTLADLHKRLHAVSAADGLRQPWGPYDSMVHLDFHPENVIMSPRGPVVIDWTKAAAGPAGVDVATSWVIMATSEVDGPLALRAVARGGRSLFVRSYRNCFPEPEVLGWLGEAARLRLVDPNVRPSEQSRIEHLAQRATDPPA